MASINKSKMKLELKHLAPYLPYEVQVAITYDLKNINYYTLTEEKIHQVIELDCDKLILKSLSDIDSKVINELESSDEHITFISQYNGLDIEYYIKNTRTQYLEYWMFLILVRNHFDVFDLIENNIAVDVNSISA